MNLPLFLEKSEKQSAGMAPLFHGNSSGALTPKSSHIVEIQGGEASMNFLSRNVDGVLEEQQGGQCERNRENERKVG